MTGVWKRALDVSAVVGAGVLVTILLVAARHRSVGNPIDMPISLKPGELRTPEFRVKNGPYDVIIRVRRTLPIKEINCVLGIRFTDQPNCATPPAVVVNWKLWSEGKIVDSGPPKPHRNGGAWSSDFVEAQLWGFDAKKSQTYSIELDIVGDGSELDVTDPHLVVQFSDYD